jgi:ferredoxin-NADP reductase
VKLARREEIAAGTYAFTFNFGREPFAFTPGQAIDLFLPAPPAPPEPVSRAVPPPPPPERPQHAFTIAGTGGAEAIQIATRIRQSEFKKTLLDMPLGTELEIDGPWGEFVLPNPPGDVVCLAGGIGVTPFHAIAQSMVAGSEPFDLALIHSNRTPEETPYFQELKRWSASYPRFNYAPTMTQLEKSTVPYVGLRGRIDAAFLDELLDDNRADALYMVAGPEAFVRAAAAALLEVGVPQARVMTEEFPGYEK